MLTEKQLKGAWLLASGRTGIEACTGAGVTENTLYKWKRKPEFEAAVAFLQEQREAQIQAQAVRCQGHRLSRQQCCRAS